MRITAYVVGDEKPFFDCDAAELVQHVTGCSIKHARVVIYAQVGAPPETRTVSEVINDPTLMQL